MAITGSVTATDRDGVRVLTVLDVYDAPELREAGIEAVCAGRYRIVVDLSGVTYMDSTSLGVLVGMLKRTTAHGGWVRLACLPDHARSLFHATGLYRTFVIADTVEAAIAYDTEGVSAA
jgi:anti-sigma B factor antagonist